MNVVIDANMVVAIVLPFPYSDQVTEKMVAWKRAGMELLAPLLLEYEVAAILRKAVAAQWLTTDLAIEAMGEILDLKVRGVAPTAHLHEGALRWAERLGQAKAYDAHYLALAEQEGAELWTADRRLANGAQQAGAHWAHWIGESAAMHAGANLAGEA
jgi:predicted nucleic acid-binding protein